MNTYEYLTDDNRVRESKIIRESSWFLIFKER